MAHRVKKSIAPIIKPSGNVNNAYAFIIGFLVPCPCQKNLRIRIANFQQRVNLSFESFFVGNIVADLMSGVLITPCNWLRYCCLCISFIPFHFPNLKYF